MFLTLLVTHSCNIKCRYCYEHHKQAIVMSRAVALHVVKEALIRCEKEKEQFLHITYMGGEPFLNFKVIRETFEWLERTANLVRIEASATTNGTLITQDIKRWLLDRADRFKVQLSFDGLDEAQGKNRTIMPVDLDFFHKTYPLQGVHVTVDSGSLAGLASRVIGLMQRGIRCSVNLAHGSSWTEEDGESYVVELRRLSEYCLCKGIDLSETPILAQSLENIGTFSNLKCATCRDCGDFRCYDVDGVLYPCHLFSPLVEGETKKVTMESFEADETLQEHGGLVDCKCNGCPLCAYCYTCYGFNYLLTGSTGTRNHDACKMMFSQAFAISEHQVKYFVRNGVLSSNASMAAAAVRAYRLLSHSNWSSIYNGA